MDKVFDRVRGILSANPKHYLVQTAISGLAGFLFIWLASHYTNDQELGAYFLTFSYAMVAAGSLNLGLVFGYERGFFEYEDNIDQQRNLLSSLFYSSLLIFTFFGIVFYKILALFFNHLGLDNAHYLLMFAGSCSYIMQQYFTTYFRCLGDSRRFLIFASMPQAFLVTTFLFINYFMNDQSVLALAYFLAQLISILIVIIVNRSMLNSPFKFDFGLVLDTLKISAPMTPRVVFGLLAGQIDKIFIGELVGPTVLASYGIAQSIAVASFQFMTALSRVFQPDIYRLCFGKLKVNLGDLLTPYLGLTMAFSFAVSVGAYHLILFGFADHYSHVPQAVNVLIIGYLLLFIGKVSGIQLAVGKKLVYSVIGTLITIAVNIVLIEPLYWALSLNGVALAFSISQGIGVVVMYCIAQATVPLPFPVRRLILIYCAFISIFFAYNYISYELPNALHILIDILVLVSIYVCALKFGLIQYLTK